MNIRRMIQVSARGWRAKSTYAAALTLLLTIWIGIPEFNKWQADRVVDRLCAKDGGDKIYEVIALSADKYNLYWIVNLGGIDSAKNGSEYYIASSTVDIQGNSNGADIWKLVIWRSESSIVRSVDKKVMAKLVSYVRRGGDPIGPWHPSHYACPEGGFSRNVFIKRD